MEAKLKYGRSCKTITLPDNVRISVMNPRVLPVLPDFRSALEDALDNPLGRNKLEQSSVPSSVAIAVPDETRPVPLKIILPVLLGKLFRVWPQLEPGQVTIVVGGGLHPASDQAQLKRLLPDDLLGCVVVSHDAMSSPMIHFGTTSRGTPVEINAAYAQADFKIVVGMIDPHQFQGMTGGAKGVAIGCASKASIQHNHSLMSSSAAKVGSFENNPARLDINEAGRMIGIDLAVNLILNPSKKAIALLVGDPDTVLLTGKGYSEKVYGLSIDHPFDIVIASCGGDPKDICLYQAQKGLNMASQCAVEGGKILLIAACPQGVGDEHYLEYVRQFASPVDQMKEFAENGFRMGAHKAFLFSRTLTRFTVVVDSELDTETLAQCHLVKGDAQATVDRWINEFELLTGNSPRIAVVPNANTTYFYTSNR